MKKYYRDKLPKFIDHDLSNNGLILTDDLDSLLSCTIMQKVKKCNIQAFFALKYNQERFDDGLDTMLYSALGTTADADTENLIGIDFARISGKTYDNHVTQLTKNSSKNPESVNINTFKNINRNSYGYKYCGSTLLQIWSIYDLPKTGLSDELMMLLIAIDSSMDGYFKSNFYREQLRFYMVEVMELDEFWKCIERHSKKDFQMIAQKYKLGEKIKASHGHLSTKIDIDGINNLLESNGIDVKIELPKDEFKHYATYANYAHRIQSDDVAMVIDSIDKVSFALTNKDFCNYCTKIKD